MKLCPYAFQLCELDEGCVYPPPGDDWWKLKNIAISARNCVSKAGTVPQRDYETRDVDLILQRRETRRSARKVREGVGDHTAD